MRSTKRSYVAVALLAAVAAGVRAEGPTVSGFVDVGYNYNLNGQQQNIGRAFDDKANNIILQNAKVGFDGKLENNVGYKVDLMYGHDAAIVNNSEDNNPANQTTQFNLQQAFLTFACPLTGSGVTLGKFVSPFGVEVVEAKDNFNISRGLLFQNAVPFSHTGLKAEKGIMDGKLSFMLGLVNGWDKVEDNNPSKAGIAQVTTTLAPMTTITAGGFYGAEDDLPVAGDRGTQGNKTSLFDLIVKVNPISPLTLIANYDAKNIESNDPMDTDGHKEEIAAYQGFGLHANYAITEMLSVAGRWETWDGNRNNPVLSSETLTAQAKEDGVIYRLEYRADHSTFHNKTNGNLGFQGDTGLLNRESQTTIGAQVIVTF